MWSIMLAWLAPITVTADEPLTVTELSCALLYLRLGRPGFSSQLATITIVAEPDIYCLGAPH